MNTSDMAWQLLGMLYRSWTEHRGLSIALGVSSLVVFLGSLAAVPWWVGRLPEDYFVRPPQRPSGRSVLPLVLRNLLGVVILAAGVAMLVLPGQGVLAILAGLAMLDFPGKRRLMLALVRRPSVARALGWLRQRKNKPPLLLPD